MTEVLVQYDETLTALDELERPGTSSRRWSGRLLRCASSYWAWQRTMRRRCRTQIPWRIRSQSQSQSQNRIIPVPYRLMRPTENNRKRPLQTVSPVQRLAQLTAELDALHNDRLLVSPARR
ncbi:hypothetical protein ACLB1T_18310 [Escherichia coli]